MHKGINSTVDEGQTPVVTHSLRGEGFDASEDGTGRGTPLVAVGFDSYNHAVTGDVSKTLDVGQDYHHVPNVFQPVAFHPTQDPISSTEVCHSIGANENATAAVATMRESGQGYWVQDDIAGTIDANMGMSGHASRPAVIKQQTMQVRRLTPTECERLQGFPDNYTAIPWHKKPIEDCPDGPRYKALGNSMAVPVMAWIGKRINELEA
jgi:DNA (cytosine-5)-methyltransferase 1